jgi:hypothetical protein
MGMDYRTSPLPRLAALILMLAACSTPDSGSEIPGCECVPDEPPQMGWDVEPSLPTCGEELCPIVNASGSEFEGTNFTLTNPEALECALMALRDRSPGIVRWTWEENGGQFSDTGYILVQPEGTGVHRNWGAEDLAWVVREARAGELPSAQYYDDCLAEADAEARFRCLRKVVIEEPTICDEAWSTESI